ncbi:MAG TPA: YggS family pyridoxal phosphate-dependent enzyme [Campylobacterales bacterium]|nr:YggS family pyridoxal phosphate-dependent enzyme [Campylobacterales bacterium]
MKERLRNNLDQVIANIEQARITVSEHHIVKIVAVGKYSDEASIATLYALGQRAFGENQVQQLATRMENLDHLPLEWHIIGSLQSNKINKLLELRPSMFQALDSLKLAEALNKRLTERQQTLNTLLQINAAGETTKSGVALDQAVDIYQQIQASYPQIKLKGVMSIGAHTEEAHAIQKSFEDTYKVYETLQKDGAKVCSMGMSNDYELAIRCGSNLVRIGSKIFN